MLREYDRAVLSKIEDSMGVLKEHLDKKYCIYGVNTGFGGRADARTNQAVLLQAALLQLTQAGILVKGDLENGALERDLQSHAMPTAWVRAGMIVRCNTNVRGHSAVSIPVLRSMLALLEQRITPIVPLRGSISASGDLMPLSYIAGAIEGSPDVYVRVQSNVNQAAGVKSARDALKEARIPHRTMQPKEGLGLVNGTAFSAALASLMIYETHQLAVLVQALSAMGVESIQGTAESFHSFISSVRPHPGQKQCAESVLGFLAGSRLSYGIKNFQDPQRGGLVQDRYSFRSVPQWLGPYLEDLILADQQISIELNSTSDNPLIDTESKTIYNGANFQATAITTATGKGSSGAPDVRKTNFLSGQRDRGPKF